jgi:hypothetical protein
MIGEGKKLGLLSSDSRGFALSMDLLLALIPLTLVLGFVAADMDNLLYQMEDTVFRGASDRVASDAVNNLLATSGDPIDWETTGNANIVGLAQYDPSRGDAIEGTIDPLKLAAITPAQMQGIIGPNYNFYMSVSTINKTGTPIVLRTMGNSSYASAKDVVKVERVALASKFKVISSLIGQIRYSGGSRSFTIPTFQTSATSINNYDYWIFIANNQGFTGASVSVNNNVISFNSSTIGTPAKINSTFLNMNATVPNQYYNNTVTLNATGSFPSSMDFYIVQTPKNVAVSEITSDSVIPKRSVFDFYLWSS